MHAVAVYTLLNQRILLIEMQRQEEQSKPGTRGQKAPCSPFVLKPKLERGGNKFPSEVLY
jgi:hypothetical protein